MKGLLFMKNQLKVFENAEFGSVRTVEVNGVPYFVGRDVATILGYKNIRDAISNHVDEEDKGVAKCDTLGGTQEMVVINESGLYALIFGSKLPKAKKFKRWVTNEVLPSIRKTGGYGTYNELVERINQLESRLNAVTLDKPKNKLTNVDKFILECCIIDPDSRIRTTLLYDYYLNYCKKKQSIPFSKVAFNKKLRENLENSGTGKLKRKIHGYDYYMISIAV